MRRGAEAVLAGLSLIGYLLLSIPVHAQEFRNDREGLDVVFAVDCSGSMKSNDPDKMGIRMIQAFIDTVHSEDIRIGYVAYDHEITGTERRTEGSAGTDRLYGGYRYGAGAVCCL